MRFVVYAIMFDQDTFGLFATRAAAEASLEQQIADGGPAWRDCDVVPLTVEGEPELVK